MSRKQLPVIAAMAVVSTIAAAPLVAAAPEYQHVRTVSGAVRCVISADHVGCERTSIDGFPGAPRSQSGPGNVNVAGLDADGTFNYGEGNIGGVDSDEVVLDYGQIFRINGWTVEPSFDGTRFSNDATGRGMFVSIDSVIPW
ncbi:hypothetical protein [Mycobacterium sp. 1274761.0]|uniref:hypothetical protein n=1 Tax=Mycobacterium sp. 1274761.0 TaxID=1834077 RepID=UPI000B1578A9|nr:hypothetical protein [Mycobacterium sp. 1274761.0]